MKKSNKVKYTKKSKINIVFKNRSKLLPMIKKRTKKIPIPLNELDFLKDLSPKTFNKINKKINKKIANILDISPEDDELKSFIDKINSTVILHYAEKEVPDLLMLPKKIDETSSINNIYLKSINNKSFLGKVSRKIIVCVYIQYKLVKLLDTVRELLKDVKTVEFFKEKIIYNLEESIIKNNINIGYLQLKYLLEISINNL